MEAPLIYKKISAVMADIGAVTKDRKNEQQKYMFRGIEDFYQAAHPALIKHGVFCAPEVQERTEHRFEKVNFENKATTWLHVSVKVCHRFFAEDGSYVDVITYGEGLDNSDKATNKALSGAMKYALIELFCIPTKDIEDSDRTSPETGSNKNVTLLKPPVKLPEPVSGRIEAGFTKLAHEGKEFVPDPFSPPVPVKPVEPEDGYITTEQCGKLAKRFRESLRPEIVEHAEVLRHDALGAFGIVDSHGNPSSSVIKKSEYVEIGKKMVAFARGL